MYLSHEDYLFKLSNLFFITETPDILTEALKPGDQFVSIDGKKTYFDIGPSNAPTDGKFIHYFMIN